MTRISPIERYSLVELENPKLNRKINEPNSLENRVSYDQGLITKVSISQTGKNISTLGIPEESLDVDFNSLLLDTELDENSEVETPISYGQPKPTNSKVNLYQLVNDF